jgi:hypothetical protein
MEQRHSAKQVVVKLRQADVALGKGLRVPEVCEELGVGDWMGRRSCKDCVNHGASMASPWGGGNGLCMER